MEIIDKYVLYRWETREWYPEHPEEPRGIVIQDVGLYIRPGKILHILAPPSWEKERVVTWIKAMLPAINPEGIREPCSHIWVVQPEEVE